MKSERKCYRLVNGEKVYFPCPERGALPPVTMARNFARAIKDEVVAVVRREPAISPEEIERRLAICRECEDFLADSSRCGQCGCFVNAKAAWRSQSCPVGRW